MGEPALSAPYMNVLSISADPAVSETRRRVLQEHGYSVVVATNLLEVEQMCRNMEIACVIIGADIEPKMKRAIARIINEVRCLMPVLEIIHISPEIEGASTVQSNDPAALVEAVEDLLKPTGRRFSEQLYRRSRAIKKLASETVGQSRQTRDRLSQLRQSTLKNAGKDHTNC